MSTLPTLLHKMDSILKSRSIEQVWSQHVETMAEYGFDRLIYAANRFRTTGEFGDPDDALLLVNHDPDYMDVFIRQGLFLQAPMSIWAARNTGTCSWQWAVDRRARGESSKAENEVLDINEKMGVIAGYTVSFEDVSGRSIAGIGLCAERGITQAEVDHLWQEKGDEIQLLNNLVHHRISLLPYERLGKPLTARQKEVLQWIADGKTMQDTAQIMGLNMATVEKHLRLARESLNVETTAQAVMKASMQKQFFLVENFNTEKVRKSVPLNA
jgi:LuxR family transcriptional regulator